MTDKEFEHLCEAHSFGAVARNEFTLVPRAMLKALVDAAVSTEILKAGGDAALNYSIGLDLQKENDALQDRIKQLEEMYEGVIGENPALLGSNVMGLLKRELTGTQKRIKRLEELGKQLRECASWVGHSCCQYVDQIRRAKDAIEAWDKEAKL